MKLLILLTLITLNVFSQKPKANCHYEVRDTDQEDYCTQGGCVFKKKYVLVCLEYQCAPTNVVYEVPDNRNNDLQVNEDDCLDYPRTSGACM